MLFLLLAERYPNRLPEAYRNFIDYQRGWEYLSYRYAEAIVGAPIPLDDKLKILEYAAKHSDPHHRYNGIEYLHKLDSKRRERTVGRRTGDRLKPRLRLRPKPPSRDSSPTTLIRRSGPRLIRREASRPDAQWKCSCASVGALNGTHAGDTSRGRVRLASRGRYGGVGWGSALWPNRRFRNCAAFVLAGILGLEPTVT